MSTQYKLQLIKKSLIFTSARKEVLLMNTIKKNFWAYQAPSLPRVPARLEVFSRTRFPFFLNSFAP